MITTFLFDLDGTLIQTELLKAASYARAINQLTGNDVDEKEVLQVFEKYVGLSRHEVVAGLTGEFRELLQSNLSTADTALIEQSVINKRLLIYRDMLNNTELLSNYFCPYSLGLLRKVHTDGFRVVLATMSHLKEATRVIDTLGIRDQLDLILTRDDVEQGKPHPEIYLKAAGLLGVKPEQCLVVEDSVNGIRAGLNAGMTVFAVTNSVTRKSVHDCNLLEDALIVDDLTALTDKVYEFVRSSQSPS